MSLIVNHFRNDEHDGGHDDNDIIKLGRRVLGHACTKSGWVAVVPPSDADLVRFRSTNNAYTYALKPPCADAVFKDETMLEFDTSRVVEDDIVQLDELEEFQHGHADEHSRLDLSTENVSLFFQQHQPQAQSTPFFSSEPISLDVPLLLKQTESILQQIPPAHAHNTRLDIPHSNNIHRTTAEFTKTASADSYIRVEESPRNHSAFDPPDGWSTEESQPIHPHIPFDKVSSESQRVFGGSQSFIGSHTPSGQDFTNDPKGNQIPSDNMSVTLPPLAQAPRHSMSDSMPSFKFNDKKRYPSVPIPDWSSSSQAPHRHATPAFSSQPQHTNDNRNPESLGSPIYSYSGPNREPTPSASREESVYGSQYPRLYSPSRHEPQPEPDAYLPQMGNLSLECPSASPDINLPSQPSAYNNDGNNPTRVLPSHIMYASVAYPSLSTPPPAQPPPAQPPPAPTPSAQPYFDIPPIRQRDDTSDPIDTSGSFEIPGFGTKPPPAEDPQRAGIDTTRGNKDGAAPNASSSPIQDFTSVTSAAHHGRLPTDGGGGVGPRWKFPPDVAHKLGEGRVGGAAKDAKSKDATSSSPILDFTTLTSALDVYVPGLDADRGGVGVLLPDRNPGPGLGSAPEELTRSAALNDSIIDTTSESVHIRTGEGAQPRESLEQIWSQDESMDLYGGHQREDDDGLVLPSGGKEPGMGVSRPPSSPPQHGGGQKPLVRMSTDEVLYGSSGPGEGRLKPETSRATGERVEDSSPQYDTPVQRQASADSFSIASSKRSREPEADAAEAQVRRIEERTVSPPRKRRRIETRPLHDLIPEPHLYTIPQSPKANMTPIPDEPVQTNSKAYTALNHPQILPSSSHTEETLTQLFKNPYSHCAWIIPVRGTPPYANCTTASILDTDELSASSPKSHRGTTNLPCGPLSNVAHQDSPGAITWTAEALRAFWRFLVDVREAGRVGAVGLSFHCANPYYGASPSSSLLLSKGKTAERVGRAVGLSRDFEVEAKDQESTHQVGRPRLRDMDFVKVYVDAPYVKKMRDLLHAWRYECALPVELGGEMVRWRLLRGAKFVLVDERSRGVLVW